MKRRYAPKGTIPPLILGGGPKILHLYNCIFIIRHPLRQTLFILLLQCRLNQYIKITLLLFLLYYYATSMPQTINPQNISLYTYLRNFLKTQCQINVRYSIPTYLWVQQTFGQYFERKLLNCLNSLMYCKNQSLKTFNTKPYG